METFAQALGTLRRDAGISIKKLAPELGITYPYLSKLESGRAHPSRELIARVARYFEYPEDRLLIASDRVPEDIVSILKDRPDEALRLLRDWVGHDGRQSRTAPEARRESR